MKLKKIMSAVLAAAAAASAMTAFAATAGAATVTETVEIPLTYENNGAALSEFNYELAKDGGIKYTMDEESVNALSAANAGDKIVITYDVASTGQALYRAGLQLQTAEGASSFNIYVNCANQTEAQGQNNGRGNYYINADFIDDSTDLNGKASIECVFTLNKDKEIGGNDVLQSSVKSPDGKTSESVSKLNLGTARTAESFVLSTESRDIDDYSTEYPTLSNFKAVLVKTVTVNVNEAADYDYKTDSGLANHDAKGFTAEVTGDEQESKTVSWYASIDGGANWKKVGNSATITGEATAKFGAILFDIPNDAELKAGYTVQ